MVLPSRTIAPPVIIIKTKRVSRLSLSSVAMAKTSDNFFLIRKKSELSRASLQQKASIYLIVLNLGFQGKNSLFNNLSEKS